LIIECFYLIFKSCRTRDENELIPKLEDALLPMLRTLIPDLGQTLLLLQRELGEWLNTTPT